MYFDDLKITHTKTRVIQYNEYYPFGLQAGTSWTRESSSNNYLYNDASELNPALGWYETPLRNYDPVLGRFTGVDPLATKFASFSGYHFSYNNPVMFSDPSGAAGIQPAPPDDLWEQIHFVLEQLEHGGRIKDGQIYAFGSSAEAFEAGVAYVNDHSAWGNTAAGSEAQARQNFSAVIMANAIAGALSGMIPVGPPPSASPRYFVRIDNDPLKRPAVRTLTNHLDVPIWIKPDDNSLSPIQIGPKESTEITVDGVTHPSYPGQVYKVTDGVSVVFGIDVYENGIEIGGSSLFWPMPAEWNQATGGGWLTAPPHSGWNENFEKVGYKF